MKDDILLFLLTYILIGLVASSRKADRQGISTHNNFQLLVICNSIRHFLSQ